MEPPTILIFAFIELIVIGALVALSYASEAPESGKETLDFQKDLIKIDKEMREPHRFRFVLWLIYGIGFNCLIRSFSYSVLQLIGILKLHVPLGFVGEYVVTCICSFGGSFLATAFYKSEGSSLAAPYSAVLSISILPVGLVKLIVANKQTSVGDWVLWSVSIVALSLISSLVVFKFVTFPANMLETCRLDGYESLHIPSSADNVEDDRHPEGGSSDEQPTPTLQDLTDQGYTVEDVIQEYGQNKKSTKSDRADAEAAAEKCGLLIVGYMFFVGVLASSGGIESNVFSYNGSAEYLNNLILNITQLVVLLFCGFLCSCFKTFSKNYGWTVLIINIPLFIGYYVRDMILNGGIKTNTEFLSVEILWVPLKLAAIEFLWAYAFLFAGLRRAKSILSSVEPHELDSFEGEQTQTV